MHIQMQSRTEYMQVRYFGGEGQGEGRRPLVQQQHDAHSATEQSGVQKDENSVGEIAHRESTGSETTPNASVGTPPQNMDGHEVITRGIPTMFNVLKR